MTESELRELEAKTRVYLDKADKAFNETSELLKKAVVLNLGNNWQILPQNELAAKIDKIISLIKKSFPKDYFNPLLIKGMFEKQRQEVKESLLVEATSGVV